MKQNKYSFKNLAKYISGINLIFSVVFSLCLMIMGRIVYCGSVWGTTEQNYILPINFINVLLFIIAIPVIYFILIILEKFYKNFSAKFITDKRYNRKQFDIITFLITVIAWFPYFLSYYPGGIYSDTFTSISQALKQSPLTNHHPVLYTLLIRLVLSIGSNFGNLTFSLGLFTAIQMISLALMITYFADWMLRKKVNQKLIIGCLIFFVVFPLIPLYGISVWKDTPFCIALFLYILCVIDIIFFKNNQPLTAGLIIKYNVLASLVAFLRNNGIYILIGTIILLIIMFMRRKNSRKIVFSTSALLTICLILIIQHPVYSHLGIGQTEFVENLGVPVQQMCRVVAYDGNITENQKEELNDFIPYGNIKKNYVPSLVDSIKWGAGMNYSYLEAHKAQFFKLWLKLLLQNPKEYVKAYIMDTAGYWSFNVSGFDAYVNNSVWKNQMGVVQTDYFKKLTGVSFQNIVNPRHAISSAWFFWLLVLSMVITAYLTKIRYTIAYIPPFLTWLTIMIASPLAVSMRYVYILVLIAPLMIIYPALCITRYKREDNQKGLAR